MHCPHHAADRCRSCTELGRLYDEQLAAKQQAAVVLLSAYPELRWLPPVASREAGFRNKAKMVVSGSAEAPILGIRDAAGQGVDLSDCALYPASMQAAFGPLRRFITQAALTPYDLDSRRGELKYLLLTEAPDGGLLLRFVLRSEAVIARLRKHLPALHEWLPALRVVSANIQPEHKAVLEGHRELLLGEPSRLVITLDGLNLYLRPQGFFQTNTAVAAALYAQARDWIAARAPTSVWDLYCGVGGFALQAVAPGRAVTGVELEAEAVAAARSSAEHCLAQRVPGVDQLRFVAADAAAWVATQLAAAELVIVNPPRRGLGPKLCHWLDAARDCRALIYSSCNGESLQRDLAALPSFRPQEARLLDMFPQTRHHELIVRLERR